MEQKHPKIVQKLLLRTFLLLVAVAGVFLGIQYVLNWREDPDTGTIDSDGMIAALELNDDGQQVVLFDKAGAKVPSPDYKPGKSDRDIVWRPDGNRVFFSSDRTDGAYHLFRWNPGSEKVDQKSTGTLSKFDPSFPIVDISDAAATKLAGDTALITQGGFVLDFNIRKSTSQQLLPPPGGVTTGADEESGGSGQFDSVYKKFGNAFRTARWIKGQEYIAAIMKADEGEVLIIQKLRATQDSELLPRPVFGGDRIDMDVDPKTGNVVFTVLNFQFPDKENIPETNMKDGKAVKPFIHGIFVMDPTNAGTDSLIPIAISQDDKMAFGPVSVSPDGSQIATTTGKYDGTNFSPAGLAVMPLQPGGMQAGTPVVGGEIYELSWHPNGQTLVFIKRVGSERAIFKINKDGSTETKVSDGGNFMTPRFSPQSK